MSAKKYFVFTPTNHKGGVGKSLFAVNIAAGAASLGLRVGLIDTDTQGHAAEMLNHAPVDGLYNVMVGGQALTEAVIPITIPGLVDEGHLWLLPGEAKTSKIAHEMDDTQGFAFADLCDEMAKTYDLDLIVLDTSPTKTKLDGAITLAVDYYLFITELEKLAMKGVVAAMAQAERAAKNRTKWLQRETHVIGIIPNKVRFGTRLHRQNIRYMAEHFGHDRYNGLIWPPIRLMTIIPEATNLNQLIYQYAPTDSASRDIWVVTHRVIRMIFPGRMDDYLDFIEAGWLTGATEQEEIS